jgi:hypothetical protein
VVPTMNARRYRLLESVRSYAGDGLRSSGEESRAHDTHVAVVVKMCEMAHADMLAGRMREQAEHLMHEHSNITTALDYALGTKRDHASALRIVGSLLLYAQMRSTFTEAHQWCARALAGTEALETRERGRALLCFGAVTVFAGKAVGTGAGGLLLDAARIAALHGDKWAEGYASGYYAMWLCAWGRWKEADKPTAAVERLAEELNDPILRGRAGLARGWIHIAARDYARAIAVLRAVHALGTNAAQRHFIGMYIGFSLFAVGEYASAAAQWLESLRISAALFNARGIAACCEGCGYICTRRGSLRDAVRFLGFALKIRERTAVPLFSFWVEYHDAAEAVLRAELEPAEFEVLWAGGQEAREEDMANEVSARLREFSAMSGPQCSSAPQP